MSATDANIATYGPYAVQSAVRAGVDPQTFLSLIMSESGFNPTAINPTPLSSGGNASGIAQFTPATAAELGISPFDPYGSLDASASYLAGLISKFGTVGGIAAYKGSPNSPVAQAQAQNVINGTDNNGNSFLSKFSEILGKAFPQYSVAQSATGAISAIPTGNGSQNLGDAFTGYVKSKALGFSLGFFGLLIISIAIVALAFKSGAHKAIPKVAGKIVEI